MDLQVTNFREPDETRTFDKGTLEIYRVGGMTIGRASYEPGWVWTEHVGAPLGQTTCDVEHIGIVLEGRAGVRMSDGTERSLEPGDCFYVPPGHDSWVEGDEPYVSLHLMGTDDYAKGH